MPLLVSTEEPATFKHSPLRTTKFQARIPWEPSLRVFELYSVITKSSLIRSRRPLGGLCRDRAWDVHGRLGATRNVLPNYGA
jgi:hypothetical protein